MTVVAERRIELRGAARRLVSNRAAEVLISGPAGTGKSVGGLTKLHLAMMKYPGARGLLVRKTLASLGASTLEVWRKTVAAPSLACGEMDFYGGSASEPPQYRYLRNGSAVVIGGLDRPTKIMSTAYDIIVVDEATETLVDDWEALLTRGRAGNLPYSQLIGLCNPDAEHHYLYQRSLSGTLQLDYSVHEDNPAYFNADGTMTPAGVAYIARLDALTGVRYLRLRKGIWAAAEGQVYEEWSPKHHLVDALPESAATWDRYWAIDFGYRNPFVLQCWAVDPDGRPWLYREIYMTGRLVEDHVRTIMGIVAPGGKWIEPRPRAVICDHDAEDRATFERHAGMATKAADKRVTPGIEAVQARLRVADDGKPGMFVVRDAVVQRDETLKAAGKPCSTQEEFPGYVWPKDVSGKAVKEAPVKENDHGMDTTRYLVAELDLGGSPRMRVLKTPRR